MKRRAVDQIPLATDPAERLVWPARCGDRDLIVSVAPPSPSASAEVPAVVDHPSVVAARTFLLALHPTVQFTLAVMVADISGQPPQGRTVSSERGLLMVRYLRNTGLGALALVFTTPHIDRAEAFTALFDRIANSCKVERAPDDGSGRSASAQSESASAAWARPNAPARTR